MFTYNITVALLNFFIARLTKAASKNFYKGVKLSRAAEKATDNSCRAYGLSENLKGILPKED